MVTDKIRGESNNHNVDMIVVTDSVTKCVDKDFECDVPYDIYFPELVWF